MLILWGHGAARFNTGSLVNRTLRGRTVVVVGAGLAGLTAARELEQDGARVTVIEARDRVGGRVQTIRGIFKSGQHAEAGADLIEGEQTQVLKLVSALGLTTQRILRAGFTYYGPDEAGRYRVWRGPGTWMEVAKKLEREVAQYKAAGERWDSGVAAALGPIPVADWLRRIRAGRSFSTGVRAMRGFFLADPEDLSLLALVDQFADGDAPGKSTFFRIRGGNDRLPRKMADGLRGRIVFGAHVRQVVHRRDQLSITIDEPAGRTAIAADFAVVALPATTLRSVEFSPPLPEDQQKAIRTLTYGPATRVLVQFERPFWRRTRRHRAFGTPLPIGGVWDASEHQRGRPGILMFLAGGRASAECRELIAEEGIDGVVERLRWLGAPSSPIAMWHTSWEDDPLAGGGYAVFGPAFDPWLRDWLRRPAGRVAFAGEHTSIKWEGFMNGAVESGLRAAAEIGALAANQR